MIVYQQRRQNENKDSRSQDDATHRSKPAAMPAPPDPDSARGQKCQQRRVRQSSNSPQGAENRPSAPALPRFEFEGSQENNAEQEWTDGGVPQPVHRPVPDVRKQGPDP